jgi:hypothetical protein
MSDEFCNFERDRPLSFQHRIDPATLEALALPKPKNERRAIARASLLPRELHA